MVVGVGGLETVRVRKGWRCCDAVEGCCDLSCAGLDDPEDSFLFDDDGRRGTGLLYFFFSLVSESPSPCLSFLLFIVGKDFKFIYP